MITVEKGDLVKITEPLPHHPRIPVGTLFEVKIVDAYDIYEDEDVCQDSFAYGRVEGEFIQVETRKLRVVISAKDIKQLRASVPTTHDDVKVGDTVAARDDAALISVPTDMVGTVREIFTLPGVDPRPYAKVWDDEQHWFLPVESLNVLIAADQLF